MFTSGPPPGINQLQCTNNQNYVPDRHSCRMLPDKTHILPKRTVGTMNHVHHPDIKWQARPAPAGMFSERSTTSPSTAARLPTMHVLQHHGMSRPSLCTICRSQHPAPRVLLNASCLATRLIALTRRRRTAATKPMMVQWRNILSTCMPTELVTLAWPPKRRADWGSQQGSNSSSSRCEINSCSLRSAGPGLSLCPAPPSSAGAGGAPGCQSKWPSSFAPSLLPSQPLLSPVLSADPGTCARRHREMSM
jgi:hypothetical protein